MGASPLFDMSKAQPIPQGEAPLFDMSKAQPIGGTTPAPQVSLPQAAGQGILQALSGLGEIPIGMANLGGQALKAALTGKMAEFANRQLIDPMQAEAAKARQTTGLESVGHAVASGIPIIGPQAAQVGEQIGREGIAGLPRLAGQALGMAELPTVAAEGIPAATGAAESVGGKFLPAGPAELIEKGKAGILQALDTPGGKAGARAAQMEADVDAAHADLAAINRAAPLAAKGAERFHQLAENIDNYRDMLWKEGHEPGIERHAGTAVDMQAVTDAAEQAIRPMAARANAAEVSKAQGWIDEALRQPTTLQEADDLVREINSDLRGKNVLGYGPQVLDVKQAAVKALRQQIDATLESQGEQGVLDLNRRWGALGNIQDRLEERAVQLARSEVKTGHLPDWAHVYTFLHPGGAALGMGVSAAGAVRSLLLDPARMLGNSMSQLERSGVAPPLFQGGTNAPAAVSPNTYAPTFGGAPAANVRLGSITFGPGAGPAALAAGQGGGGAPAQAVGAEAGAGAQPEAGELRGIDRIPGANSKIALRNAQATSPEAWRDIVETVSGDNTLGEAPTMKQVFDRTGAKIVDRLINDGVFAKNQRARMVRGDGGLTGYGQFQVLSLFKAFTESQELPKASGE